MNKCLVKKGWKRVKLRENVEIITGKTPPTKRKEFFGGEHPFITPTDITNFDVRYLEQTERYLSERGYDFQKSLTIPPDSTCYVAIGSTIGKMCMTKKLSFTNQQIHSIITDKKIVDPFYLFYRLRIETPKIKAIADGKGSGKSIINKTEFSNLEIEIPPLEIQRKIAAILSDYDDLIENNTRRIKILEEMAQTIYKEWFVKFRFPGYEKVKMVDSELGKIPEGWKVKRLEEIVEKKNEKYNETIHNKLPLLDLGRIPRNSLNVSNYGKSNEIKTSRIIFREKDILFGAIRPYFHKIIFAPQDGITNVSVFVIRGRDNSFLQNYLFWFLFQNQTVEWANKHSGGTKMPVISWNVFSAMKLFIPSKEIIFKFNEIISPIMDEIILLNQKNHVLHQTRDLLLPKLISGEIDVENLEIEQCKEDENG
ncbi:MAG: restriction endonuclease subunit S [Candidatus Aenigmarchaeota archaeon]|nr:restriction endonuclease subunit S [Candidatus Aenigmarchaeota archaeon]